MLYIYIKKPEIWKPITYPNVKKDKYLISSYGRVYSKITNKILSPGKTISNKNTGRFYLTVSLSSDRPDRKIEYVNVHRLVAWEFVDNTDPNRFNMVHHNNNDSTENYYENLEWTDNTSNQIYAASENHLNPHKGTDHANNVYPEKLIIDICLMVKQNMSTADIYATLIQKYGTDFNRSKLYTLIHHIRKRDRWKHICIKYLYNE